MRRRRCDSPEFLQGFQRSFECAAIPGFVAVDQLETLRAVRELFERAGPALAFVDVVVPLCDIFFLGIHLYVEKSGFDGPDALEAPAGEGCVENDLHFGFVAGLEFFGPRAKAALPFLGRFVVEDEQFAGGKSVPERVSGRALAAFGCFRSGSFCGVIYQARFLPREFYQPNVRNFGVSNRK
jgi:hypothetical protein